MSRSLKKGPYVDAKLMKRVVAMNTGGRREVVRPWSRDSTIFPEMVGHTIAVHEGRRKRRDGCWPGNAAGPRQNHGRSCNSGPSVPQNRREPRSGQRWGTPKT